ncbi:MAG: FHA domain-containing protein [Acidobacteria bacterium]|nr:FHA domain-containing protein [Acidobacteriota bacterium]
MNCPNCGTKLKPTAKICKKCGTQIVANQGAVASTAQAATQQASPQVATTVVCPNGHPMHLSWTECPQCIASARKDLPPTRVSQSVRGRPTEAGSTSMALLLGLSGANQGKTFDLKSGETVLGVDPQCDIVLNNQYVSKRHASLNIEGARCVLTDLSSRNGTFINNTRITQVELRDDDKIRLGVDALFQFKRLR